MAPRTAASSRGGHPPAAEEPARQGPGRHRDQAPGEDTMLEDGEDGSQQAAIPAALLRRILHQFFEKQSTRITKDANAAVTKYVDIFVREAIARAAAEKEDGFLEVEDLERVAPQLLLDL